MTPLYTFLYLKKTTPASKAKVEDFTFRTVYMKRSQIFPQADTDNAAERLRLKTLQLYDCEHVAKVVSLIESIDDDSPWTNLEEANAAKSRIRLCRKSEVKHLEYGSKCPIELPKFVQVLQDYGYFSDNDFVVLAHSNWSIKVSTYSA